MHEKYRGITYPKIICWLPWEWGLKLWRRLMCKREMHLWDEVLSGGCPWEHYLVCDACGLMVNIESIDDRYVPPELKLDRCESRVV